MNNKNKENNTCCPFLSKDGKPVQCMGLYCVNYAKSYAYAGNERMGYCYFFKTPVRSYLD